MNEEHISAKSKAAMDTLAEIVRIEDPAFYEEDPYPTYARLRTEAPVFWYPPLRMWILSKHEDVRHVGAAWETFSSERGIGFNDIRYGGITNSLFPKQGELIGTTDPPRQRELRKAIAPAFAPAAMARLEERIREICRSLLSEIEPGRPFGWVERIAAVLPLRVLAEFVGVPHADQNRLKSWSDSLAAISGALTREELAREAAKYSTINEFLAAELARKRRKQSTDLLSILARAVLEGERMKESNAIALSSAVLGGGSDTTRSLLSGMLWALACHPQERAKLADDPSMISAAVEESLRWVSPVLGFVRFVKQDAEVRGQRVTAGDFVYMLFAAANRDETAFDDPDSFNVSRSFISPHLAFGFGPHVCPGAGLARLEARVLFEELIDRFPRFELYGQPEREPSVRRVVWKEIPAVFSTK